MTALQLSGLTARYGSTTALDDVDLTVPDGTLAALLGPSGCGKTTLLRAVAGFLPVAAGTVTVGDRVVAGPGVHVPPERRRIGIVPQEGALFPHLTIARNIAFGLHALPRAERRTRVGELLDLISLPDFGERMPHELSGGQQQRVALARALAPRPALVLLDEPFSALDSALRTELRAEVREVLRATQATAVLVTHDQQEALSIADQVAVLRDGRILQSGTPEDVYHRPADVRVATFVGDAVLLPATVTDGAAQTALGPVPLRGTPGLRKGIALLRPEQLTLAPRTAGLPSGTVTEVAFYGHDAMVTVRLPGLPDPVQVRVPGPVEVRPGDEAALRVSGEAVLYPEG